ncbi:hypothetical protein [Actinoplanes sp. NBRC 103695]|uniref:hypothetical protein n=1 Tax=Actinoplanes sp. NBRC 103695 TaxID=3032202 RepID=UPI0024A0171F|nr:hypothetical protein [Actinoplanes sp. NBRC 103695]GLY93300.1 hypothetical protein Acsp02_05560 [Actinoplanes sp. NBRC 103695]
MVRTTPPRPLDVAALFPELRDHSTTATRLHPRPGAATPADSSVGGPLLWPADEPWPVCTDGRDHEVFDLLTPATVRLKRRIYAAAQARADATGVPYFLTDEERTQLPDLDFSEPTSLLDQPIPLVPVAQLYRRDVPDFAGPDGTDLLQVLWCPHLHPDDGYNPRVRLYWRRSADVGRTLDAPDEPAVVHEDSLPTPCVVHPEQIREYQYGALLPEDLDARISAWEEAREDEYDYQSDLSLAPGWKVGGFASWSLSDPQPMDCVECGAAMTLLLAADSGEWEGRDGSWKPVEEPAKASSNPTDVVIGRGYALYVFRCPTSFDHPPATAMQ